MSNAFLPGADGPMAELPVPWLVDRIPVDPPPDALETAPWRGLERDDAACAGIDLEAVAVTEPVARDGDPATCARLDTAPGVALVAAVEVEVEVEVGVEAGVRPAAAPTARWVPTLGAELAGVGIAALPSSFDGTGTTIVVVDTGFSPYYDTSCIRTAYDFGGANDRHAYTWSLNSHGSWVAEVATDVATGAEIIHLKVFEDGASGASFHDIEEALRWVVDEGERFNAVAVNLSLGYGNTTGPVGTRLSDEIAILKERGVATVVAAGNDGESYADGINVLAADGNAIAVSAVDAADHFTDWTQRCATLTDIAAWGERVPVETRLGVELAVSGTSFAAPYVSGTVAVLQEAAAALFGRRLPVDDVLTILQASARDVADAPAAAGYCVADADAAVAWLADHMADFAPPPDLFLA